MTENRFFRFVWRVNAILAAVIGLVGITYLGLAVKENVKWQWPSFLGGQDVVQKKPAPVPPTQPQFRLDVDPMGAYSQDSPNVLFQLTKVGAGGPPWRPMGETVNLLILDRKTNANHWLFEGFGRVIASEQYLYAEPPEGSENGAVSLTATGIVMTVMDSDTNHDGTIGQGDKESVYVYSFHGGEAKKVLTVDHVMGVQPAGHDRLFVMYRLGKDVMAATYSMPEFKLLSQAPIANLPPLAEGGPEQIGLPNVVE